MRYNTKSTTLPYKYFLSPLIWQLNITRDFYPMLRSSYFFLKSSLSFPSHLVPKLYSTTSIFFISPFSYIFPVIQKYGILNSKIIIGLPLQNGFFTLVLFCSSLKDVNLSRKTSQTPARVTPSFLSVLKALHICSCYSNL